MTLQEFAGKTGMDLEGTTDRFAGMEQLVLKFLKKFPEDPSFHELAQAVSDGDYAVVERASHTLKGVAGNLGFASLVDINQKIVDAVRGDKNDEVPGYFEQDKQIYEQIISCLDQLDA